MIAMIKSTPLDPTSFLRRSPLYRWHLGQGACFIQQNNAAIVANYANGNSGDLARESDQVRSSALIDLTPLMRVGFKGAGTVSAFEAANFPLPAQANRACDGPNGSIIARLSQQEILILDSINVVSGEDSRFRKTWNALPSGNTFLLERADSHAWFALSGHHASEVLSKVCAIDMRLHKFADYEIAQTSVARANSIVIRVDQSGVPCFFVLCDLSASEFLWEGILDAMAEFKGRAAGVMALQNLMKSN